MIHRQSLKVLAVLGLCALVVSGCKSSRPGQAEGDILDPTFMEGALGERFEDGNRITDVSFENVLFGYDSYQISPSELAKIEAVADYMRRNAGVRLVVEGHCDERGSREYNMSLGEHRALAVRAHMISLNIDGSRIQTRSYGEESPLDYGHNESAWRINRRAEFALYR